MIKKELGVFRRVPGSSDQNTDLDITLSQGQLRTVEKVITRSNLVKYVQTQNSYRFCPSKMFRFENVYQNFCI